MCIDTHVTSSPGQRLTLPVGYMLLCLRVPVLFCHTKIDNVDHICGLRVWSTDEEVIWLNVSVDQILLVYCLYPRKLRTVSSFLINESHAVYHLLSYHHNSLSRESSIAMIKEVFEGRPKKINHENVMQTLLTKVVYIRYSS